MKNFKKYRFVLLVIVVVEFIGVNAWSQSVPVLSITSVPGTNQFFITFTNTDATYDIQETPVLGNQDYPWTWAAVGSPGQTNFIVTSIYPQDFYRAILDTNSIPLWEMADPNNPSLGALAVTIDSPANGSTISQ
jgi:hypothetical protein